MIVGATPYALVNVGERRLSTGKALDAIMLWGSPRAWPISWAMTWRMVSPISSSSIWSDRACGCEAPVSIISRLR